MARKDWSPQRYAYEAGWRASARPSGDLDRAESLFCSRHPDPGAYFAAGWSDLAAGNDKYTALDRERGTRE